MAPAAAVPLAIALLSAALMGMAIQRGATCTVPSRSIPRVRPLLEFARVPIGRASMAI